MRPTEFPKTLQEIFNIVWARSKDKRRAKVQDFNSTSPGCKYRLDASNPTSLACFIGECIPDAFYTSSLEEKSITSLINLPKYNVPTEWREFERQLSFLQTIHDFDHPDSWESELTYFAEKNNLTIPQ